MDAEGNIDSSVKRGMKAVSQKCKQLIVGLKLWSAGQTENEALCAFAADLLDTLSELVKELSLKSIPPEDIAAIRPFPMQLRQALDRLLENPVSNQMELDERIDDHGQNGPKTLDMSQVRQAGGAITDAVSPVTLNTPEIQSLLSARLLPGKSPVLSSKSVRSTPTSINRAGSSGLKNTVPVPSQGITIFLHADGHVTRDVIISPKSLDDLRRHLCERFNIASVHELPPIYIKDLAHDVFYLLENVELVKDGSQLKLIDSSDDRHKHASDAIMNELRSLRDAIHSLNVQSLPAPVTAANSKSRGIEATALSVQRSEIQLMRRHLGMLKQVFSHQNSEISNAINGCRDLMADVCTALESDPKLLHHEARRRILTSGKQRILEEERDLESQLRELSETVDELKQDIVKRGSYPSSHFFEHVRVKVDGAESKHAALKTFLDQIRPVWKQTWECELQDIVTEQHFLKGKDSKISAFSDDIQQLRDVAEQIGQVLSLKSKATGTRRFEPKPLDEHHDGLKTVLHEISAIEIDSEKRLQALARNEKMRHAVRSQTEDEFSKELLAGTKNLKKTGGVDELERHRRTKEENILRQLYQIE